MNRRSFRSSDFVVSQNLVGCSAIEYRSGCNALSHPHHSLNYALSIDLTGFLPGKTFPQRFLNRFRQRPVRPPGQFGGEVVNLGIFDVEGRRMFFLSA
jgi:hypothetical protein